VINDAFGELFLATVNETDKNPVHLLFNQWWRHASDDVKQAYVDGFAHDPQYSELVSGRQYAEPLVLDELRELPAGSLGRVYHDWIVDNGLTAQIAMNYRQFHNMLVASGQLDGMPEPMQYAVLRGFQTHDFQHVVTGYDSSGLGEIALQAFCLAQLQFPYFGMWISVVTTKMTFISPTSIVPLMDAITDGWQLGRTVDNIQAEHWEDMVAEPLEQVRSRYHVTTSPLVARLAS
jgi:ubiquinone biosynthesis protein COQ4